MVKTGIGVIFFVLCFCGFVQKTDCQTTLEPIKDIGAFCSKQKGFNLLGKFDVAWSNTGFTQNEFSAIKSLGFNFVRLPLDFRTFTEAGNWDYFIEREMVKIDQAVEWGRVYNIHVCINFHRAPGYGVNETNLPPNQQLSLWTDVTAQTAFVKHWEIFASRYKNIPAERLSFNLLNEPSNVTEASYVAIMKKAIQAIRTISPHRLIFIDALDYARKIIVSLKDEPNVAQAIHCYDPFQLTHYMASWVNGSSFWPVPIWPMLWISNYLYGPWKSEYKSPLVFQGNFSSGTEVIVNVNQISSESTLQIKAGAKIIFSKKFLCGPDLGTDFTQIVKNQYGYQNISNKNFSGVLTESASSVTFENTSGDWMTLNSITLKNGSNSTTYYLSNNEWGKKQATYRIDAAGALKTTDGKDLFPFEDYQKNLNLARINNIPVMVQEFGVHNKTPHKVTTDFLADLCKFFSDNNLGWALWNLTGSFGILNSDRSDCRYEMVQGYKLDRIMLESITKPPQTSFVLPLKQNSNFLFQTDADNKLYILFNEFGKDSGIIITDINGKTIVHFFPKPVGTEYTSINLSSFKPGVYVASIYGPQKRQSQKFVVNN